MVVIGHYVHYPKDLDDGGCIHGHGDMGRGVPSADFAPLAV